MTGAERRRVYIAGPITGYDLPERREKFAAAARELAAAGYAPVNPFTVAPTHPDLTWRDYMCADIAALVTCDGVATLNRWEESPGATIEVRLARDLGMNAQPLSWWLE